MINKVLLVGRISDAPEVKQTPTGDNVCSFFLAVNRRYNNTNETDYILCEAWGSTAFFISRNIKQGDLLDIEGSVRIKKHRHEDKNIYEQVIRIDRVDISPNNSNREEHI